MIWTMHLTLPFPHLHGVHPDPRRSPRNRASHSSLNFSRLRTASAKIMAAPIAFQMTVGACRKINTVSSGNKVLLQVAALTAIALPARL